MWAFSLPVTPGTVPPADHSSAGVPPWGSKVPSPAIGAFPSTCNFRRNAGDPATGHSHSGTMRPPTTEQHLVQLPGKPHPAPQQPVVSSLPHPPGCRTRSLKAGGLLKYAALPLPWPGPSVLFTHMASQNRTVSTALPTVPCVGHFLAKLLLTPNSGSL